MTPYQVLNWEASTRGAGAYRLVCPDCRGGTDSEKCLTLVVDTMGQMAFRCYRSSCGFGGGNRQTLVTDSKVREPRYFTADTVSLSEDRKSWFDHKFGFVPPDTLYAPHMDRYVYTVRGPTGAARGHIARSFAGAVPKVLTYWEATTEPFIGWCVDVSQEDAPLVIVEDWLSAEKVYETGAAHALALNGTYLSLEMVREIIETVKGQVILALDRDAWPKALKYRKDLGDLFSPAMKVWRLDEDLKYESLDRIREAVEGRTDFHE